MGTMMVTGTSSGAPTSQRRTPKRAVRGSRRHAIQKLKHYCKVVFGQDAKESTRAEELNYVPYLFTVRPGNTADRALKTVLTRCEVVLEATLQ